MSEDSLGQFKTATHRDGLSSPEPRQAHSVPHRAGAKEREAKNRKLIKCWR